MPDQGEPVQGMPRLEPAPEGGDAESAVDPTPAGHTGPSTPRGARMLPAGACLVLLALAVGVIQRGGYNPTSRLVLGVLAVAGLGAAVLGRHRPSGAVLRALLLGWLLLCGSAALSAGLAGDLGGAVEIVGLVTVFAAGVAAASATPVASRPLLADALLVVAVVVAASAWVGVVWRLNPWGYHVGGLWRGGSTLTYANAAAALLGMVLVLTLVRSVLDPSVGRATALGAFGAGVGLAVTLNRAGVIAVVVGLLVALVLVRPARLWPTLVRQGLAIAIGAAGAFPGLVVERSSDPVLASATLLLGAAVAWGFDRRWSRRTTTAALAAFAVVLVAGAVVLAPSFRDGFDRLTDARLSFGSDDRTGAWGAAVDEFTSAPIVGGGPSTTTFAWTDGTGSWTIQYVHNEYLELLATQGLIGAAAALVAMAALVHAAWRADLGAWGWLSAAVAASLTTFFVHCAFDFLLHVPALSVAAGLVFGLALPPSATVTPITSGDPS